MNNPEPTIDTIITKAAIQSLQHWWAIAGVDLDYRSKPVSLLAEPLRPDVPKQASRSEWEPMKNPKQAVAEPAIFDDRDENFPDGYDAFQKWLGDPKNLLESNWARNFVLPDGCLEPEVMIISSMPEASGAANQNYYSSNESVLLKNMLSAIGIDWEHSFRAALSFARTIDGRLTDKQVRPLVKRALHLISLVKPKQIIIFGDSTSRAFFDEDSLSARKKKQFINHVSSKTDAIVTFHPRILLERPELKAETWKDLQMLTRIAAP